MSIFLIFYILTVVAALVASVIMEPTRRFSERLAVDILFSLVPFVNIIVIWMGYEEWKRGGKLE